MSNVFDREARSRARGAVPGHAPPTRTLRKVSAESGALGAGAVGAGAVGTLGLGSLMVGAMAIGALGIGLRTMAVIIRPMIPTGPQYPSWSIHSDKAALLVTAVNAPVSSMTQ